ncbi:MAG: OsmC family protein [Gammaproteobacteria bacterium]|nr:MAG: OsmC family protein [Gammaproteobacteria bacterium]
MKARVKWIEHSTFVAQSGSGHSVVLDGPPEAGGQNLGVRPMEMVLLGLGGCTAFDVVDILRKKREPVTGCAVEIEAERAETVPKVFTKIHVRYIVTGKNVKEESVRQAVELSAEKYCSVSIMLGKTARMTHDYQILNEA